MRKPYDAIDPMDDAGTRTDGSRDPGDAQQLLRVMVVDDHELFRNGLRRLLDAEGGLQVVGDARRGDEAVRKAADLRPDVIVMDIHMPGMSGIEATHEILAVSPGTAVVILTISDNDHEVLDAVLAGASGYVLKRATLGEITSAIRAVGSGESAIATRVTGSLLERLRRHGARDEVRSAALSLSERELDVLALLVTGCDNTEIGKRLHLSPNTIKRHVSNILRELGVENRIQAAVLAVQQDLLREHRRRQGG